MKTDNKYQILWLNDDLRVDEANPYFRLLNCLRDEAENKFDLSIQACVTADDFLSLANDESISWDVFILDVKIGKKDVFGGVLGKIDEMVQSQGILLYCFTRRLEPTSNIDSSIMRLLTDYNFSKSQQGGFFYSYSYETEVSGIQVFNDIFNKLEEKGKLFQSYPEIEEIYDEIKQEKGGENEATKAIINLLKWNENNQSVSGFEEGIRTIMKSVGDNLCNLGFFNKSKVKPGYNGFSSVSGFYINIMQQDTSTDEYLFSDACRLNWEGSALHFLGYFSDIVHHDLQKVQGDSDAYNKYYRSMVFNAFVLYSKWYSRFKSLCAQNGGNNTWMFNPLYGKFDLPLQQGKRYNNGELVQNKDKTGRMQWGVNTKYSIDGHKSWRVDFNENTSSFQVGMKVSFEISASHRAINILL